MAPGERAERWLSAHLYYHDRLDPLLTEMVAPLVRELSGAGLVGRCFFLRYWDGGPHLRLRLRLRTTPGARAQVKAQLVDRHAVFTRAHPAPERLDPVSYRRRASRLARWEGLAGFAPEPYPNNSLAFVAYRPEHHRYGRGRNLAAVERHFAESSRIALDLICAGATAAHRRTAAFSMILLAWQTAAPAPGGAGWPALPPADPDPAAEAAYRRQRQRLRALAVRTGELARRTAREPGPPAPPDAEAAPADALTGWAASLARLRATLAARPAPDSILDTCAHLMCNRLGIEPNEEGRLRYLAARTTASLTDSGGSRHALAQHPRPLLSR
jgi:hypothetical protein